MMAGLVGMEIRAWDGSFVKGNIANNFIDCFLGSLERKKFYGF